MELGIRANTNREQVPEQAQVRGQPAGAADMAEKDKMRRVRVA
jgi:hypothetical protein